MQYTLDGSLPEFMCGSLGMRTDQILIDAQHKIRPITNLAHSPKHSRATENALHFTNAQSLNLPENIFLIIISWNDLLREFLAVAGCRGIWHCIVALPFIQPRAAIQLDCCRIINYIIIFEYAIY